MRNFDLLVAASLLGVAHSSSPLVAPHRSRDLNYLPVPEKPLTKRQKRRLRGKAKGSR